MNWELAVNFNSTVSRLRDYVNYIDEISKVLDQVAEASRGVPADL